QLVERPARPGDPDDRDFEVAVRRHVLEGREDLLVGEVPGRAEEDEGVGGAGTLVRHAGLKAGVPGPWGRRPARRQRRWAAPKRRSRPGFPGRSSCTGSGPAWWPPEASPASPRARASPR